VQSIAIFVSVCLSACISQKRHVQTSCHFLYITCGLGSVLLSRQYNTLCTSGFVDDVTFSHTGANTDTGHY